jgi:hypothetical protein
MTSAEFSIWLRYHAESPIDDSRADLRMGILASTVANYSGKVRSDDVDPARPRDFMPFVQQDEPEVQSEPDPIEFFTAQAALFDGGNKQ